MYTHIYIQMCIYVYVYMHIHTCTHIYIYIYICICLCIYIHLYIYTCIHMHLYLYTCIYTYTCQHEYIYLSGVQSLELLSVHTFRAQCFLFLPFYMCHSACQTCLNPPIPTTLSLSVSQARALTLFESQLL